MVPIIDINIITTNSNSKGVDMSDLTNVDVWAELVAAAKSGSTSAWPSNDKAIIYADEKIQELQAHFGVLEKALQKSYANKQRSE